MAVLTVFKSLGLPLLSPDVFSKAFNFLDIRKRYAMSGMIVLAFLIGYPLFMLFAFAIAKLIFTPLEKIEQEQRRERELLLQRSRRVSKIHRLAHAG